MGASLYDQQGAVRVGDPARHEAYSDHHRETFRRRLAEAQAFGEASDGLSRTRPEFSARGGLTTAQRLAGWLFVAISAIGLVVATHLTFGLITGVLATVFAFLIGLRLLAVAMRWGLGRQHGRPPAAQRDLPVITLLIPLHKEATVLADLVRAVGALDYPRDRLDVKLLIEADDAETLEVCETLGAHETFEVIPVPPGHPRTKPKALNYGLAFARGDIVAIFDAEDRPHPGQLRAAVAAFRAGGDRLAVVQAPLNIHNGRDAWLSAQFEVEYAIHFRVWLPMLARLGAPLALGGTSNYFRRDVLEAAGGWDAWNVTEDADIGLRLARLGYRASVISPPTEEEAPTTLRTWLNQRTRWMKGYLQTWLVLNRSPIRTARGMGLAGFLMTQLTLGGALLAAIAHGPLLVWILANTFMLSGFDAWHVALFGFGYASALIASLASGATHARLVTLLTLPIYWPLQSLAVARALYEMKRKPHYWAKTPHGAGRPSAPPTPVADVRPAIRPDDNVIQLPLPF